jgi:phosphatidylglycerophosphate synthase
MSAVLVDAAYARKPVQTLFGKLLFRRVSLPLSLLVARTRVRPSHITALGLGLGLAGAGTLATGTRWGQFAAALLVPVAKLLDAMDGEVARAKHLDTPAGYVTDGLCDRLRDTAVIIGAGVGVYTGHNPAMLGLTLAAVAGYLAFFYVSGAFPAHWREVRDDRDLSEKHLFRVTPSVRLGAGDTMAVTVCLTALLGRPEIFVGLIAVAAPLALVLKVRSLFRARPWERNEQAA